MKAIRELKLTVPRSRFAALIRRVEKELVQAGIRLAPVWYLSTEYGVLAGSATIALLWTDGFAQWQKLAHKKGLKTRDQASILRTLRHELGHAFCYTHRLYRRPRFRRVFGVRGNFWASYPNVWRPRPKDRARLARGEVILIYSTRHPDEDFAVCFEFWLSLRSAHLDWREVFAGKPLVLQKLAYVEQVVERLGKQRPVTRKPALDEPLSEVLLTAPEWIEKVARGDNYNLHANGIGGT